MHAHRLPDKRNRLHHRYALGSIQSQCRHRRRQCEYNSIYLGDVDMYAFATNQTTSKRRKKRLKLFQCHFMYELNHIKVISESSVHSYKTKGFSLCVRSHDYLIVSQIFFVFVLVCTRKWSRCRRPMPPPFRCI